MVRVFRPIPVESLKLLVFDLDGTLIDSARDLCNSVNATLVEFEREPLPDSIVASYIGDGAVMLVRRALFGVDATEVDEGWSHRGIESSDCQTTQAAERLANALRLYELCNVFIRVAW